MSQFLLEKINNTESLINNLETQREIQLKNIKNQTEAELKKLEEEYAVIDKIGTSMTSLAIVLIVFFIGSLLGNDLFKLVKHLSKRQSANVVSIKSNHDKSKIRNQVVSEDNETWTESYRSKKLNSKKAKNKRKKAVNRKKRMPRLNPIPEDIQENKDIQQKTENVENNVTSEENEIIQEEPISKDNLSEFSKQEASNISTITPVVSILTFDEDTRTYESVL